MLDALTGWLLELLKASFKALWDFIGDVFIFLVEMALKAISAVLGAVPVPAVLANGLQTLFSGVGGDILYLLGATGLAPALAFIGAGYAFRLVRKVVTLFQW